MWLSIRTSILWGELSSENVESLSSESRLAKLASNGVASKKTGVKCCPSRVIFEYGSSGYMRG